MPVVGVPMNPLPPFVSPFIGGIAPYGAALPVVPATGRSAISFEKHGNLAYSTVATAPSPATTGTSMVLGSDSSTFPSPTAPGALPYSVTVWPTSTQPTAANSEIVTFTALDPGTLTATMLRAQEGSTARTIVVGDQVALTHTVAAMTQHEDAILGLDSRLGLVEALVATIRATQLTLYPVVTVMDQKAQVTDGGTFNSGAWTTRDLNTLSDPSGIASLAANRVTLPAGTYAVIGAAPAFHVNQHCARLMNITDGGVAMYGTSEFNVNSNTVNTASTFLGSITITGSKAFEVQHQCATSQATNGFGVNDNFQVETYTRMMFIKLG